MVMSEKHLLKLFKISSKGFFYLFLTLTQTTIWIYNVEASENWEKGQNKVIVNCFSKILFICSPNPSTFSNWSLAVYKYFKIAYDRTANQRFGFTDDQPTILFFPAADYFKEKGKWSENKIKWCCIISIPRIETMLDFSYQQNCAVADDFSIFIELIYYVKTEESFHKHYPDDREDVLLMLLWVTYGVMLFLYILWHFTIMSIIWKMR